MRSDLLDLISCANGLGIYTAVAASVTPKLNQVMITRMREAGVSMMSVSLDGALPQTHDKIRRVPGTWDQTICVVQMAKDAGLRVQVNTTVMRSNLDELADIFHIARQAGAVAWEVFFLIRTGRGTQLESVEPWECEEVAHFLFDASHYDIPVRTAEGPHFRRVYIQRTNGHKAPDGHLYRRLGERLRYLEGGSVGEATTRLTPTGDGKGIIFVGHDGEINPSGFLPLGLGRLPRDNLCHIYRSHSLLLALRDPSKFRGRCGRCEYKNICGGSRSRAFAELGDPLGEDPACVHIPSTHPS
jgi:MoaA/NifB/PqqE/SkfB family radical SAM enzyme